jgi:hypothetical protein
MYDDLKNTEDGFDTFGRFLAYLRDPRLGKGERATFRKLVLYWLNTQVPDENLGPVVSVVCSLIGEHGYYKDLVIMWEMIGEGDVVEDKSKMMMSFIANFMVNRLRGDMVSERPSMLAKWMPRWRKNRRTNGLIDTVSAGIWSNAIPASVRNGEIADKTRAYLRMQYRKTMSALCEKLNVVERKMCANEWGEIVPKEVPSVATNKYRKAFLNLTVQGGKRHEDPGRILCAERFTEATKSGTLNANVVDIARVVQQMMIEKNQEEIDLLNTTWRKLEDDIGDEIVGMVPMIDVSGSMMGTPMYAAIGIGLMLARKNRGPLNGM